MRRQVSKRGARGTEKLQKGPIAKTSVKKNFYLRKRDE